MDDEIAGCTWTRQASNAACSLAAGSLAGGNVAIGAIVAPGVGAFVACGSGTADVGVVDRGATVAGSVNVGCIVVVVGNGDRRVVSVFRGGGVDFAVADGGFTRAAEGATRSGVSANVFVCSGSPGETRKLMP